jgi:acyl dehydratase
MPVRAGALGAELDPVTVDVTARWTLAYAAATGFLFPRTFDDAGPEPLVAPPPFCVRLEWAVLLPGRGTVLGLSEVERLRAVHVEQDSTFHRPVAARDRLTTSARVVAIRQTRAGALVQTRLVTAEAASGAPVATSWHTAIYRGVPVEGADGRVEDAPAFPAAPGPLARATTLAVPREAAHVYTECAGIWNPIHSERRIALAAGLPDIVLHGTATWAMAGREVLASHASGDPTRLRRLRARFVSPVVPGTDLAMWQAAGAAGDVHFDVTSAHGETVLADGYARVE